MAISLEQLDTMIARANTKLERYRKDALSKNWEIANGSKLLVEHTEADLEILTLAKKGLLAG